jgi:polysaccharide export outer membrane protein
MKNVLRNTRIVLTTVVMVIAAPAAMAEGRNAEQETPAATAQTGQKVLASRTPEPSQVRGDYVIGAEDVLDISVWNNTTISRTVPVRPDGMISLPLLNDVRAAGRTPLQLRDDLMTKLADFMPSPEVSVIVREVHSAKVSVVGSVKKAGRFELKAGATVLDLLAQAEGVNEFASPSRIVVLRTDAGASKRLRFNYYRVTNGSEENFALRPGDIIVVP